MMHDLMHMFTPKVDVLRKFQGHFNFLKWNYILCVSLDATLYCLLKRISSRFYLKLHTLGRFLRVSLAFSK